jgi:adenylate cyclase
MMEMLGKYLTSTWTAAISAILLLILYVVNPSPIETLQLKTFDYLINTLEKKQSEEIILVEFGEKSVQKFGQWPFDRRDIAQVINDLRTMDAGVIAVPILFSERDRAGGDNDLAKSLSNGGVVISQTPTSQSRPADAARRGFASIGNAPDPWLYTWRGAVAPLKTLADSSDGVGLLAVAPERDGVVRRMPMLARIGDTLYPSLVLETLRTVAGDPSYQIKTGEAGVEAVRIPQFPAVKTDERGRIWLGWNNGFERIEATELTKQKIENKIVILGLTIEGVGGIIATPTGEKWAHEIQANALQTIIDGTSISRLPESRLLEGVLLLILCCTLLFLVPRTSVFWTTPLFLSFVFLIGYGSYFAFTNYMQLWDPSYILAAGVMLFGHLVFNNFAREFRLKQQIKKQFGTYLSPALVEKLQMNPELLRLGGETRELSIMFTDVRGFTTISEHYGSNVQGLTEIMNRYMTAMTAKILENNGTLDKYIGDAQMAFWNAPLDDADHAKHAVKTALEMLNDLERFNNEIRAEGTPAFGMGLGINTGSVVVGNMGSSQRFDYTCLGDSVNLASRLEGQSKPYHVKLVIGQRTYELVKDDYLCLELDCLAVKGKTEGVNIYTIVDRNSINIAYSCTHEDFIKLYRAQQWDRLDHYYKTLENAFDGDMKEYYDMMMGRVEEYKKNPPGENWDGVFRTNSK